MDKLLLLYLWLINSLLHLLNFIFLLLLFFFWHLFTLNFKNQLIYFNVINFLFIILIKNSYNFIFFPIKINSVFLYLKLYFIFQFPIKTVTMITIYYWHLQMKCFSALNYQLSINNLLCKICC